MPAGPLLFLDVDGTLLATGGPRPTTLEDWYATWQCATNPALDLLDPSLGRRLVALPCELVWATAWLDDANAFVAPRLGLPALPVLAYGEVGDLGEPVYAADDGVAPLHRKTAAMVAYAAARPFAWLDDELTATDRSWVAEHHPAPALLHRVDPARGITPTDVDTVATWVAVAHAWSRGESNP